MILVFGQVKKHTKIPQTMWLPSRLLSTYLPCASLGIDAIEIGLFRFSYCMIWVVGLQVCKLGQNIGEKIKDIPAKLLPSFGCAAVAAVFCECYQFQSRRICFMKWCTNKSCRMAWQTGTHRWQRCFYYFCTGFLGPYSGEEFAIFWWGVCCAAFHGFRPKRLAKSNDLKIHMELFMPNPCVISE